MHLLPRNTHGSRVFRITISIAIIALLLVAFSGIWCYGDPELFDVLRATPSPTPPAATPAPSQTPEPPAEPTVEPFAEEFSIIWLSDTQTIAYFKDNKVFRAMGEWIMAQQEPLDIRYIVQTGDMVDNGFRQDQWDSFNVMFDQFYGKIPYLPIAGNHDIGVKAQDYRVYTALPFVDSIPAEQSFRGGQAVYATFQAGGEDFIIIGAGWGADVSSALWINGVLRAHPDHIAILLVHSYLNSKDRLSYQGDEVRDLIIAKNPNIRLVLAGHIRGSGYRMEEFDDDGDGTMDRTVHAMLYNYQEYPRYGCGQLRILTFDTTTRNIHVTTYSPYTDRYYSDRHFKAKEFDLPDAF